MDFGGIRKQKIDKTYIDEAFKEIPLYESMAVSSERESYRLAKELLTMGQVHPQSTPNPKQITENVTDRSAPTLQSLYLSPGPLSNGDVSPNIHTEERSRKSSQNYYTKGIEGKDLNTVFNNERNILPQILRDKPLDSPSKVRFDQQYQAGMEGGTGINYGKAQSFAIKEDYSDDAPPNIDDINEFKGKFSEMKRSMMKSLVTDLQKKENDFYVINYLKAEKSGRVYPKKIFLMFGSQEEILDTKDSQYRMNFELIRLKLSNYFEVEVLKPEDNPERKPVLNLYIVYQRGKTWEYIKVTIEGTRNSGVSFRHSQYNPSYSLEIFTNDVLDKYIEGMLKPLVSPMPVLRKQSHRRQPTEQGIRDGNVCSIWDSGIEVYKRLAKDYAKLSHEKISREQIYFMLLEKFYAAQIAE